MNTSEQIDAIAAALAKAQGEFKPIPKNKTGKVSGQTASGKPYSYEYKYAALPDVLEGIKAALSSNGLAYVQATLISGNMMILRTRLVHVSGQFFESDYPVCAITNEHQKMGAAGTYARRYALTSLVGVAADEDADGHGAETVDRESAQSRAAAEAAAYVAQAEKEIADIDSVDRMGTWWNAEKKNRALHFHSNEDPLLDRLKKAAADRSAALKAEAGE